MIPAEQQQQQNFDPSQNQWYTPQQQAPYQEFADSLRGADPALVFFANHPHFVKHLAVMTGTLVYSIVKPLLTAVEIQIRNLWLAQMPADNTALTTLQAALNLDIATTVEAMGLDTDSFLAVLTDHQIAEIQQMHEYNHYQAVNNGYAHANHQDPAIASAYMSPWGVSYQQQGGNYGYQPHQGNPYAQPYYPNQPVGMANPYGQPTMTGALFGLGASWLQG